MEMLRHKAYARAGLLGNPSDGYHGKTISICVPHFSATVILYEWETLEIIAAREDRSRFDSIGELAQDVELHGYYGGIRLVKATIKKFVEFCDGRHELHNRNFSIRYDSNIPRAVGLAGSSAIIVATLRAGQHLSNKEKLREQIIVGSRWLFPHGAAPDRRLLDLPHCGTHRRHVQCLDFAAMLARRAWYLQNRPTFRYLAFDASPQRGLEIFVTVERVVSQADMVSAKDKSVDKEDN